MKGMVDKIKNKFDKHWGDCNLLLSVVVVLDPRYKKKLIEFCFPMIYSKSEAEQNINLVMISLDELYGEYASAATDNSSKLRKGSTSNTSKRKKTKGRAEFETWAKESDVVETTQSELELYLKESHYKFDDVEDSFNVLEWWKINASKFKILSILARDILSIPISSAALEFAFSVSGRVFGLVQKFSQT